MGIDIENEDFVLRLSPEPVLKMETDTHQGSVTAVFAFTVVSVAY